MILEPKRRVRSLAGLMMVLGISMALVACSPAAPATPTVAPKAPSNTPGGLPPAPSPVSAASPAASPAAPAASPAASAAQPGTAAKPSITPDPALASVWAGKTVTVVVGQPPGGGHDAWARLVARYIGKYLPGTPQVIVQNMPGAVSAVAANFVYQSNGDGLTIGEVSPDIPTFQLQAGEEKEAIRYEATKFGWVGSAGSTTYIMFVNAKTGIKSINDMQSKSVRLGEQAPGGVSHRINLVLKESLGIKVDTIFGYTGTREITLGVDRGEVDALYLPWDSALQQKGDDIRSGALIPLVAVGPKLQDPLLANTPTADELLASKSTDLKQLMNLTERPLEWFRPFIASPNTPPATLNGLRTALTLATTDAELLKDAAQLKFDVDHIPGEKLQGMIGEYMQTPRELVDRLDQMVKAESPS